MLYFFILLVCLFILAASYLQQRNSKKAFEKAAVLLDFECIRSTSMFNTHSIEGTQDSIWTSVDTIHKGSGKSRKTYVRYRVNDLESTCPRVRIFRQGFFTGIAKVFGYEDIEIDVPELDGPFIIQGTEPQVIVKYFNTERRKILLELLNYHASASFETGSLCIERRGTYEDAQLIADTAQFLHQKMLLLRGNTASEKKNSKNTEVEKTDSEKALDAEKILKSIPQPLVAVETQSEDPPGQELPVEPDLETVCKLVSESSAQVSTDKTKPVASELAELDVAELCKTLFAGSLSQADAAAFFKTSKGKRVVFEAILERSTEYNSDVLFGRGPAIKVTLTLAEVETSYGFPAKIRGLLALPLEAQDSLEGNEGQ